MTLENSTTEQQNRLKQALIAIKSLRAEVESLRNAQHEPVAILGIGCRFPGGVSTPAEFWRLLCMVDFSVR